MVNRGVYPLAPDSEVGKFRLIYGDTVSVPLNPAETGFQDYQELSDDEITAFINGGSVYRGIGRYYLALAGKAALVSGSIADYDLKIDETKRSGDLRAIAQYYFDLADEEDNGGEDAFTIVPTGRSNGGFIPEGTIPQWGREYTWSIYRGGL